MQSCSRGTGRDNSTAKIFVPREVFTSSQLFCTDFHGFAILTALNVLDYTDGSISSAFSVQSPKTKRQIMHAMVNEELLISVNFIRMRLFFYLFYIFIFDKVLVSRGVAPVYLWGPISI